MNILEQEAINSVLAKADICPFCGNDTVIIVDGSTFRWKKIECGSCGASCGEVRVRTTLPLDPIGDAKTLVHEWNTRWGEP